MNLMPCTCGFPCCSEETARGGVATLAEPVDAPLTRGDVEALIALQGGNDYMRVVGDDAHPAIAYEDCDPETGPCYIHIQGATWDDVAHEALLV